MTSTTTHSLRHSRARTVSTRAGATLAIAASLGAGALTSTSDASAASLHGYAHLGVTYTTSTQCLTNRNGAVATIQRGGGTLIGVEGCVYTPWPAHLHRPGGTWSYDYITYTATRPLMAGDILTP